MQYKNKEQTYKRKIKSSEHTLKSSFIFKLKPYAPKSLSYLLFNKNTFTFTISTKNLYNILCE